MQPHFFVSVCVCLSPFFCAHVFVFVLLVSLCDSICLWTHVLHVLCTQSEITKTLHLQTKNKPHSHNTHRCDELFKYFENKLKEVQLQNDMLEKEKEGLEDDIQVLRDGKFHSFCLFVLCLKSFVFSVSSGLLLWLL